MLSLRDGAAVWLTAGRPDTSAAGSACEERLLEIRTGNQRLPVPLLYTIGAPDVVNDSTIRASLFRHCAPTATYLVNTKTGHPERER